MHYKIHWSITVVTSIYYGKFSHFVNFQHRQFPLCQLPTSAIPTLSIPTLSTLTKWNWQSGNWQSGNWRNGNWQSGKLAKWELRNGNWQSGKLAKWELAKWELTKWELTKCEWTCWHWLALERGGWLIGSQLAAVPLFSLSNLSMKTMHLHALILLTYKMNVHHHRENTGSSVLCC